MTDFSVVIPVFNRALPLEFALNSVLDQSHQSFEIIVVDDGSELDVVEEIKKLIQKLADPRICLIQHLINQNGAAARNTGIKAAKGKFICFLDSDDEWLKNKLEVVWACIKKIPNKQKFLVHHQYQNRRGGSFSNPIPNEAKLRGESVAHYSFITNNVGGIQSSTICVPTELAKICLFDEKFTGHQDWDFSLKVGALTDDFSFIDQPLTIRSKDSHDSVADGLSWQYSLWFYGQTSKYFDTESALFYFQRVILKKSVMCIDIRSVFLNWLFLRAMFFHPIKMVGVIRAFLTEVKILNKRLLATKTYCKNSKAQSVMVWGLNQYAEFLINSFASNVEVTHVIDNKAEQKNLLGVPVTKLKALGKNEINQTNVIILATDLHERSMTADLQQTFPEAVCKVIKF